jgi:hypothetical protein
VNHNITLTRQNHVEGEIRARVNQGVICMSEDKNQLGKDVIYTIDGKAISLPIEITDSFRFTKRSMYEDEPKPAKKSLFSRIVRVLIRG